ncbi:XRE family transcriptional regulator [Candidatus Pacearchaeota archaeon]|nr:XRE family transcriptional regulator [Candidatus Pacearchaeota archaeon]
MKNTINIDEIKKFLDKANKHTYANKNASKVATTRLKSEDYNFEEGDLIYHDTYFGEKDFIGGEIVYKNENPVLGANYFGFILDNKISEKEIYNFLRQALMLDYESEVPVRGPVEFSIGEWTYNFTVNGNLSNFQGEEQILFKGKIAYRGLIHGGFVR